MEAMRISSTIFSIKEIAIVFLLLLFLLSPNSYSLNPNNHHESTLDSTKDVLVEEKSRLGSMPPSCYNKCNQCHPCRAIQVPSLPSHDGVEPRSDVARTQARSMGYAEASKYSNYKPLGWKCRLSGTHEHSNSNCHAWQPQIGFLIFFGQSFSYPLGIFPMHVLITKNTLMKRTKVRLK